MALIYLLAQSGLTSAASPDQVDVTAAEISAVVSDRNVQEKLRHSLSDPPKNGIASITHVTEGKPDSYFYAVQTRQSCWINVYVKSHVDSSSGKVIVDSIKPFAGACD